jgi:uncharacterized protein YuzE
MEKNLNFYYDKEGDILDISIGRPKKAISEEISEDFFLRKDRKTGKIVGFMMLNFEKRFTKLGREESIPVTAVFSAVRKGSSAS